MNCEPECETSRAKGKKAITTSRSKRIWMQYEDKALVDALVEIASDGYWKVENGFRSGYLIALEKKVAEKIKDCTLKANPHIESRVKTLKKLTVAISEMRGSPGSGFGWNQLEHKIVCERHIFDGWVKGHPNAAGLFDKSFPYYDDLVEVFGHDHATGAGAEDAVDAHEDIEARRELERNTPVMDYFQGLSMNAYDTMHDTESSSLPTGPSGGSSAHTGGTSSPPRGRPSAPTSPRSTSRRKRQRSGDSLPSGCITDITDTLREFVSVTKEVATINKERLQIMIGPIQRRQLALDELIKLPCLFRRERNLAGLKMAGDDSIVTMFLAIPEEERVEFIRDLLST